MHLRRLEKLLTAVSCGLPEGCVDEVLHSSWLREYVRLVGAEPIVNRYDDEDARDPARNLQQMSVRSQTFHLSSSTEDIQLMRSVKSPR